MRTFLAATWHRLKAVVLRRRLERDLDDELAFHLSMREAELMRDGLSPARARDDARRQFGNVAHFKEQTHDMWTFEPFENLRQDVRFALRTMRKSPGFSIVAIAALAIGIGGNTAIFSMVDAIRARAMPYGHPDRLVQLWGNVTRAKVERRGASYPDYLDWRAQAKSFDDIAAFDGVTLTLLGNDEPERINVEFVAAPYFDLLGIAPTHGRTFRADEDEVARPAPVIVLSDGLWRRRFGADTQVVGRTVTLSSRASATAATMPFTVIGVMPPGFQGLTDAAELWVPFALYGPPRAMAERGSRGFAALARLKPGVSIPAAQAEMDGISRQLERAYPASNEKRAVEISPLDVELFGTLRGSLLTLMAAVGFVLAIACANVANLLIARSEVRRREVAVRTALGAGRGRLMRQMMTESCVLTLVGAGIGLLLARVAVAALLAQSPVTFPSFVSPALDLRVAAFTIVVSVLCGILVGIAPGLQARDLDLNDALKDSSRGSGGRRSQRLRSGLVVVEISLAVVLLVGAGLMIRSVRNLIALDPGFDPESLLTLRLSIPRMAPPVSTAATAMPTPGGPPPVVEGRLLLDRLQSIPGVVAVSLATDLPLDGNASAGLYSAEGMPAVTAQNVPRGYVHRVTPDFFATLRIPIVSGRTFTQAELAPGAAPGAVVVSERVVKRFWPGQDAIGRRIKFGPAQSDAPWMSIVGVVGEVKYRGLPDNPTADPDIYLPFSDRSTPVGAVVRTSVTPSSLVAPIRAAVRALDSSVPVYSVATMESLIGSQTSQSRFTMWLMGIFAVIALALAVIGIYGVMSYLVTQRTREIGIRLALGAEGRDILRLVVGNGARLIAAGIVAGLAAAFVLERLVSSLLFGVTTADAASAGAVAILAAVALLACYVPALRAMRVDPLHALRYE
ncbi:MAG TPA: ABC transporter permease [Vicinamibacterales bacterium]